MTRMEYLVLSLQLMNQAHEMTSINTWIDDDPVMLLKIREVARARIGEICFLDGGHSDAYTEHHLSLAVVVDEGGEHHGSFVVISEDYCEPGETRFLCHTKDLEEALRFFQSEVKA